MAEIIVVETVAVVANNRATGPAATPKGATTPIEIETIVQAATPKVARSKEIAQVAIIKVVVPVNSSRVKALAVMLIACAAKEKRFRSSLSQQQTCKRTCPPTRATKKVMAALMEELKAEHACVGDVRAIGLLGCIELVRDRQTKEPLGPFMGSSPETARLGAYLRERGVYTYIWRNLLHTNPPLTVTPEQLQEVFAIINDALALMDEYAQ